MSRVKNQHYVPQFYLRHFSDDNSKIHVLDKKTSRSFCANVRNVGGENWFYEIPELRPHIGDIQVVERFFQPLEGDTARVISELVMAMDDYSFAGFSSIQREVLSVFIAAQWARTKNARKWFTIFTEMVTERDMRQRLRQSRPEWADAAFKIKVTSEAVNRVHAQYLLNPDMYQFIGEIIHDKIWMIIENRTYLPFFTSDNPVGIHCHVQESGQVVYGFGSRGAETFIALSPKYMLLILERRYFQDFEHYEGTPRMCNDVEIVEYYNAFLVRDAYRYVFSQGDEFSYALRILDERPTYRDPPLQKVHLSGLVENVG